MVSRQLYNDPLYISYRNEAESGPEVLGSVSGRTVRQSLVLRVDYKQSLSTLAHAASTRHDLTAVVIVVVPAVWL